MTLVHTDIPRRGLLRLRLDGESSLNALNEAAKDALLDGLARAVDDRAVRAVLLTGTGRAFCAGGDVSAMGERTPLQTLEVLAKGRRIIEAMTTLPMPVVVAVNGLASGAGFNLSLAGDVVVAHRAAWFQQSFTRMGWSPTWAAPGCLPVRSGSPGPRSCC